MAFGAKASSPGQFTTPPTNPANIQFFIEGLLYTAQSGFFTVAGSTITWTGFSLPLGARVEAVYQ